MESSSITCYELQWMIRDRGGSRAVMSEGIICRVYQTEKQDLCMHYAFLNLAFAFAMKGEDAKLIYRGSAEAEETLRIFPHSH